MGTLTGLGTRRTTRRMPYLALISGGLLLASLVLLAIELSRFASSSNILQSDITVAGVPVGGKTLTEAVKTWETIYAQPVQLDYGDSPILLDPREIGFVVKSDQMRAQVQARSAGSSNYWVDFWNYLWRRPSTPLDIPLASEYQKAKLQKYLVTEVAARYEERAGGASFDLNTLTFSAGSAGRRIDIEKSVDLIDQALHRPTNRRVTIPLQIEAAKDRNMNTLRSAIVDYLANFPYLGGRGLPIDSPANVVAVSVIDLTGGAEMHINRQVAFSAASTIKLPILINRFRSATFDLPTDIKWLMAASILCSSNSASNFLIQTSGNGSSAYTMMVDGLNRLNDTMKTLGAKNTYINAPLYVGDKTLEYSVPAPKTNPDKAVVTRPDPFSQTTAEDMAVLLQGVYDCAEYNTGIRLFYPDAFTQTECREMLELLSGNHIGRLIELGVPPDVRVAHKNGWAGTKSRGANVGDAAIVYAPGATYVLVVYIWEARATDDGRGSLDAWRAVEGISRVVYNYFDPDKPLLVARTPEYELGASDCVMPNPNHPERIDLSNIANGRFQPNGDLVTDACVNYPACLSNPEFSSKATTPP